MHFFRKWIDCWTSSEGINAITLHPHKYHNVSPTTTILCCYPLPLGILLYRYIWHPAFEGARACLLPYEVAIKPKAHLCSGRLVGWAEPPGFGGCPCATSNLAPPPPPFWQLLEEAKFSEHLVCIRQRKLWGQWRENAWNIAIVMWCCSTCTRSTPPKIVSRVSLLQLWQPHIPRPMWSDLKKVKHIGRMLYLEVLLLACAFWCPWLQQIQHGESG